MDQTYTQINGQLQDIKMNHFAGQQNITMKEPTIRKNRK